MPLDEFMNRAERVLSSEIARREDLATVGTTMRFIGWLSDGVTSWRMEREQPREADIESAAARVQRCSSTTTRSSTGRSLPQSVVFLRVLRRRSSRPSRH
jgi:hypothetical protein